MKHERAVRGYVRCTLNGGHSGGGRRHVSDVPKSEVVALFNHLVCADGCYARAAIGPLVQCPSRRFRAIPKDNLVSQIHEGAQARGHVAAPWII
jgi:hypothetical protein